MKLHDRYYASSVVNTLLFYGTVVLVCFVFNVFVALFIVIFFLRFYRREIWAAIHHPVDVILRPKPVGGGRYRFDVLPPSSLTAQVQNPRPPAGREGRVRGE